MIDGQGQPPTFLEGLGFQNTVIKNLFIYVLFPIKQSLKSQMSQCTMDSECPWQFFCGDNLKCQHDPIFPLQVYPIFIYLLMPLAAGLVNMTGNSMGIFNVLLLMNLLRYEVDEATVFIQPMVAGAALPKFFNIIVKRHPWKKTSLVDYNIIYIIIPCSLLGSTLGAFLHNFIPQIASSIVLFLFYIFFSHKFWKKLQSMKKQAEKVKEPAPQSNQQPFLQQKNQEQLDPQQAERREKIQKYESSIHLPDILVSFTVFLVFQFLVFAVQGKLPFYGVDKCDILFFIGLLLLAVLVVSYLFLIRIKLMRTFKDYQLINYTPNVDLSSMKTFFMIALGGLSAGLVQGMFGVGSGTFTMAIFLSYNLDPRVASATSGYQIFFIGTGSFIQTFINGRISLQDAGFLFGVCAILGGLVTFGMYRYLGDKDPAKVNILLVKIILVLCIVSILGVIPTTVLVYVEFGWERLSEIEFHC